MPYALLLESTNHDTLKCFACGGYRDDLYHYLRCPCVSFIFSLPLPLAPFILLILPLRMWHLYLFFFETYYIVMKQFKSNFLKSDFKFIAKKTASVARHVAIKDIILNLARISCISYAQVQAFMCT